MIFADEAQDLNRLQLTLIRRWGEHCDHFIFAGDDDQLLYPWTGCTPEALLDPELPSEHIIVLKQSYRLPRAVHAEADKLIRQVTRRQQKEYLPRDAEGSVQRLARGGWKSPKYFILKTTLEHLERGQTVMFLAPCAYMLQPYIAVLRKNGIPFHNPYRLSNGAWNPLANRAPGASANRVLALLAAHPEMGDDARPWTFGDVKLWCEWLTSQGVLRRGAKTQVAAAGEDRPAKIEDLDLIFEPAALDSLLDTFEGNYRKTLEWWQARVGATYRDRTRFPVSVASLRGPQALIREPQVIVGTIHSVKGGEADCSPPDEPVLTTQGYVPIGDLDPQIHRLVSYTSSSDKVRRGVVRNASRRSQAGYPFSKVSRPYSGELVVVSTSSSKTRVTPNHHLIVRWAEATKGKFIVYLMKKGLSWRVGQCKTFYGTRGQFGLCGRAAREGADCAWILSVHDTRADAGFHEALIASRYGIPMLCFKAGDREGVRAMSQDEIDEIHRRLDGMTIGRAEDVLFQHGRDPKYPFCQFDRSKPKQNNRQGTQYRFHVRACNLVPDLMEIPTLTDGLRPNWETISVEREHFDGTVYSLDVQPYHYYVSGGAVVHNCVFLVPDMSAAGQAAYLRDGATKDSVIRLFYVGLTRARETVYICSGESAMAVRL